MITLAAGTQKESIEASADEIFTGQRIVIAPISRPLSGHDTPLLEA